MKNLKSDFYETLFCLLLYFIFVHSEHSDYGEMSGRVITFYVLLFCFMGSIMCVEDKKLAALPLWLYIIEYYAIRRDSMYEFAKKTLENLILKIT